MSLDGVRSALRALNSEDLLALMLEVRHARSMPLPLQSWLEHAIHAEMDRTVGKTTILLDPNRMIEPQDVPRSVLSIAALAITIRAHGGGVQVEDFLTAVVDCLKPCVTTLH